VSGRGCAGFTSMIRIDIGQRRIRLDHPAVELRFEREGAYFYLLSVVLVVREMRPSAGGGDDLPFVPISRISDRLLSLGRALGQPFRTPDSMVRTVYQAWQCRFDPASSACKYRTSRRLTEAEELKVRDLFQAEQGKAGWRTCLRVTVPADQVVVADPVQLDALLGHAPQPSEPTSSLVPAARAETSWGGDAEHREDFEKLLVEQIARTSRQLQAELNRERQRSRQLAGGVAIAARWANSLATCNKELVELAGSLRSLLGCFYSGGIGEPANKEGETQLQLASATLANSDGRLLDALDIVKNLASSGSAPDIGVARIRGDALFDLGNWAAAIQCYEDVLRVKPDDWDVSMNVAYALVASHRAAEAAALYDRIIQPQLDLALQGSEIGSPLLIQRLIIGLHNRGGVHHRLGHLPKAIADYEMATLLLASDSDCSPSVVVARALNHNNLGCACLDAGALDKAVVQFDSAIQLLQDSMDRAPARGFETVLAMCFSNRGNVLSQQQRTTEAIDEYTRAIEIHSQLMKDNHDTDLVGDLASCYHNRGGAFLDCGDWGLAVGDFERAITIRRRLVDVADNVQARQQLAATHLGHATALYEMRRASAALHSANECLEILCATCIGSDETIDKALSSGLRLRGRILRGIGEMQRALEDVAEAIRLRRRLLAAGPSDELLEQLAYDLMSRGLTYALLGEYPKALQDYHDALEALRQVTARRSPAGLRKGLALCLLCCGLAQSELGDADHASEDCGTALAILDDLLENSNDVSVRRDRAIALVQRGIVLRNVGAQDNAMRDYNEAVDALNILAKEFGVVQVGPALVSSLNHRGIARTRFGDFHSAIEDFSAAVALGRELGGEATSPKTTDIPVAFSGRGFARYLNRDLDGAVADLGSAIDQFERWLSATPNYFSGIGLAAALLDRASMLHEMGRTRAAGEDENAAELLLRRICADGRVAERIGNMESAGPSRAHVTRVQQEKLLGWAFLDM